jgi:hypothetical protein
MVFMTTSAAISFSTQMIAPNDESEQAETVITEPSPHVAFTNCYCYCYHQNAFFVVF